MRFVVVAVVAVLIGCGGGSKSAPQPQQPPISNTAPMQHPPPSRASDCGCAECSMSPKVVAAFCHYTDQVCACKDMDCITKAGEGFAKEAAELAKESKPAQDMTEADKAYFEKATKRLTECTVKVTDEMMKNSGAGSGGSTP